MNIINIRCEIANLLDRWQFFGNLGCASGRISRFTAWELEHTYYSALLFDFEMRWNHKTDHAGLEFGTGIFGYGVHFRIYDTRHWNHFDNCWEDRDFNEYFDANS